MPTRWIPTHRWCAGCWPTSSRSGRICRIDPVESSGTDNAIYRLGEDMAVRLPRIPERHRHHRQGSALAAGAGTAAAGRHLPAARERLARAGLSLALVGTPLAGRREHERRPAGRSRRPGAGPGRLRDRAAAGRYDGRAGRRAGRIRGVPLARRDAATREAIAQLDGVVDGPAVTAAWESAVRAPTWQRPGVWIHGDLLSGNVLVDGRGRLSAVIDFGCMAVGDPACDVMAAWTLFEPTAGRRSGRQSTLMTPPGHGAAAGRSRSR